MKTFKDKNITIRKLTKKDLGSPKKFLDHINSLIAEEAKILYKNKQTLKDEKEWLKDKLQQIRKRKLVLLVAEYDNIIVGNAQIHLNRERRDHVGGLGIGIRQDYRGIGLGKHLIQEIIELAKRELKPKPKIIQLEVYVNNKPAIALYKKMGFKIVAKIPKQIQYKGKLIDEFIMQKYL